MTRILTLLCALMVAVLISYQSGRAYERHHPKDLHKQQVEKAEVKGNPVQIREGIQVEDDVIVERAPYPPGREDLDRFLRSANYADVKPAEDQLMKKLSKASPIIAEGGVEDFVQAYRAHLRHRYYDDPYPMATTQASIKQ